MGGIRRHRRSGWIGKSIALVLSGVVLTGLVYLVDRLSRPPLTDRQSIRATVESYLEACRDRDFEAVWELQSHGTRGVIGAQRADRERRRRNPGDDEAFFVAHASARRPHGLPADPTEWFLWALPAEILDGTEITRITVKPDSRDTGAIVELRPTKSGRIGSRTCRIELVLVREGEDWRVGLYSFYLTEDLPARSSPLPLVRGTLEDGRSCVTLGLGREPAPSVPRKAQVLIVRVDRRATFGSLTTLLRDACGAGFEEIRIRPERRHRATSGSCVVFNGLEATRVTSDGGDPAEIVYPIPTRPYVVDLVIGVGRRGRPDWAERSGGGGSGAGALPFRTSLSAEASRALGRFTSLLGKPLGQLDVLVSCHETTDIGRLANVWSDLVRRGCLRPILAIENPTGAGYASAVLINGLRPEQILRTTPETLPRVWPDNPVLQRTITRPE